MALITIREALRQAMAEEMRANPEIFLIGEEVGVPTPVGTRNHVVRLLAESGR